MGLGAGILDSDVIKTIFQDQDLSFKTKPSVQDQDLLWCILEADRETFFIFGRKRKCRRNGIPFTAENENGHSFSAENENESHQIIFGLGKYYVGPVGAVGW